MLKVQNASEALKYLKSCEDLNPDEQSLRLPSIIHAVGHLVKATESWLPALPILIHVRNQPVTQNMDPQFEPLFDSRVAPMSVWMCGRQVGKSTQLAVKKIIMSAIIPHFQTLSVTPQFEMTRRFSSNYVKPLLERSPIASIVLDTTCEKSVLQKTLTNLSMMHFSFAFLDCDRVRGIPADRVHCDEAQDIQIDFIDEIRHTTDRSPWRILDMTGTPKTFDNTMHGYWMKSSQAEWLIPCTCGYTNVPVTEADALKMIGDKTLICAKCQKPLDSTKGYWYHFKPENKVDCVGYHIPQIILPFHYASPRNWRLITKARDGHTAKRLFYNEILGEACDLGSKLITETDLRRAAKLPIKMSTQTAHKVLRGYTTRALGIDWGGRGEDTLSFTKLAVLGMTPDGRIDLLYGENLSRMPDAGAEVAYCARIFKMFNCNILAHDAAGTAGMRDVLFSHSGFPMNAILPMCYVTAWTKEILTYHETTETVRRPYFSIDKTKSLILTAECIKNGFLRFPEYESCKELLEDFLALIEEKSESKRGSDIYLINRAASQSDDFAHAVNFAAMALFHTQNRWPDLINAVQQYSLTQEELDRLSPGNASVRDWEKTDDEYL